jgi:hypothetical protein
MKIISWWISLTSIYAWKESMFKCVLRWRDLSNFKQTVNLLWKFIFISIFKILLLTFFFCEEKSHCKQVYSKVELISFGPLPFNNSEVGCVGLSGISEKNETFPQLKRKHPECMWGKYDYIIRMWKNREVWYYVSSTAAWLHGTGCLHKHNEVLLACNLLSPTLTAAGTRSIDKEINSQFMCSITSSFTKVYILPRV